MRILISPRPTTKYSAGIFLGGVAQELNRRGYQWTGHAFHYLGFSLLPWDYAFVIGCPKHLEKILNNGKPVILTMGKPESRDECDAVNRDYLPEFEQQELMMAKTIMNSDKVVFNSQFVREIWKRIFRVRGLEFPSDEKVKTIHHGVDTNVFSPIRKEDNLPFVLGTVGAFRYRFRLATLFKVSQLLDFEHRLLIVGSMDTYCKEEFGRAMKDRIIAEHTEYIPWIDHKLLPNYYRKMHCLFHPVDYESFGLVTAEALACGVPVVVPAHGAPKEYISNGGILVKTEQFNYNDKFCLLMAEGVAEIRKNWEGFSRSARESAIQNISIEKCTDSYLDFMGLGPNIKDADYIAS